MIRKTYIPYSVPPKWSSVHQPIRFVYDMPTEECVLYNHATEGYLSVWSGLFMDLDIPLTVGGLVFITSGTYQGYHVVKKILGYGYSGLVKTSVQFQTETLYTTSTGATVFDVKLATPPVWNVYAGYQDSEISSPNPFPYTKVSEIQPEGNGEGLIEFNCSGYVQSAMNELIPPTEGTTGMSIDYSLFMPYRICTPVSFDAIYFALNSGIDTDTLNREYVGVDKPVNSLPIEFGCGTTWLTYIEDEQIVTFRTTN